MVTVLLLVFAGCVSRADGPSPTDPLSVTTTTLPPTTTTTVTLEQGLTNYRDCLAEEGVAIDEIQLDGLGRPRMALAMTGVDFTDRAVLDALDSCGPQLSSGALELSADPELQALVQANLEDFATCIRDHGVADYPSPVPAFDGLGSPYPVNRIPWADPALPTAVDVCSSRLGQES